MQIHLLDSKTHREGQILFVLYYQNENKLGNILFGAKCNSKQAKYHNKIMKFDLNFKQVKRYRIKTSGVV